MYLVTWLALAIAALSLESPERKHVLHVVLPLSMHRNMLRRALYRPCRRNEPATAYNTSTK